MSDSDATKRALVAVRGILDALGVSRVVCVDDEYTEEPQLEQVLAAALGLPGDHVREIFPEIGDVSLDDQDVRKTLIRKAWRDLDSGPRTERAEKILAAARLKDDEGIDDLGDASILSELIPEEKLLTLSPKKWEEQKDDLLREEAGQRTLFLFDRDLSNDGGDAEGGIKIIASLLSRNDTGGLICGLLTHTVTPENQLEKWAELSNTHHVPRDRFIVIPKQYLSRDPVLFARTLKWVALSPDFTELKNKTKTIIAEAMKAAAARVDNINIFDLDHMVFRVSADEGLWEPDMLLRLHGLFHRLESRQLAHRGNELETIAQRLRAVSHIPTESSFCPISSTWRIQHEELYEPGDYLNRNHLPLELGDIFVKSGGGSRKHYILLAQPCDLMVRPDGERHPELVHVPLIEIAPASKPPQYGQEMVCFSDSPGDQWYANLKRVHQVQTRLLDLCTFNDDGSATIRAGAEPPVGLRPAVKARYAILATSFARLFRRLDLLEPVPGESPEVVKTKAAICSEVTGDLLMGGPFGGASARKDGQRGIAYDCQRVSRLSRARALALLMAYTGCLNRPAFDREFG